MQETHEKKINGRVFMVSTYPAMRGWRVFTVLSKGVLPAIASVIGSVKSWEDVELDGDGLAKAAIYLVTELEADKSEALIRDLLEYTFVDGQEVLPQFDTVFRAEYGMLMKILAFVIQVNFASFLGESGLNIIKEKIAAQTEKV